MRNQDTFQKIPVRKKPNTSNKNLWKYNRKLQRKLKLKQQEKFYAKGQSILESTQEVLECTTL